MLLGWPGGGQSPSGVIWGRSQGTRTPCEGVGVGGPAAGAAKGRGAELGTRPEAPPAPLGRRPHPGLSRSRSPAAAPPPPWRAPAARPLLTGRARVGLRKPRPLRRDFQNLKLPGKRRRSGGSGRPLPRSAGLRDLDSAPPLGRARSALGAPLANPRPRRLPRLRGSVGCLFSGTLTRVPGQEGRKGHRRLETSGRSAACSEGGSERSQRRLLTAGAAAVAGPLRAGQPPAPPNPATTRLRPSTASSPRSSEGLIPNLSPPRLKTEQSDASPR